MRAWGAEPGRAAGRAALTAALLLVSCASSAQAQLQIGGSLAVETDYRFRGISLSDEQPDARASIVLDHAGGAYAGASITAVKFPAYPRGAGLLAYGGYTAALTGTLRWEAGATWSHYPGDTSFYDYGEVYVGLLAPRWSLRGYYAPDYFGLGERTVYLEANGSRPIALAWQLIGHLGVLQPTDGSAARFDVRLGAVWRVGEVDLQLAWVGVRGGHIYPSGYGQRDDTLVLGAAWSF